MLTFVYLLLPLGLMASEAAISSPFSYLKGVKKEYEKRKRYYRSPKKIKGVNVSVPMGRSIVSSNFPLMMQRTFLNFYSPILKTKDKQLCLHLLQDFIPLPSWEKIKLDWLLCWKVRNSNVLLKF